ncbi:MAG: DUF308 domain-containing protein [Eubacteriaceae bacterium]|nr:DUF308 domain-containing protein [Eubacteriaceae bacterium]
MNTDLSSITTGSKTLGIIVSIVMVLLGIGVFIAPQFFALMMIWIFIVGLVIYGIFLIFAFSKSDVKNGWNLTTGIMALILGLLLIFSPNLAKAETFAFILGFMTLFTGINQITASLIMKKQGSTGTGWLTASGIINIILAMFFIFSPFIMLYTFSIIAGVYLVFGGIALFAETFSSK